MILFFINNVAVLLIPLIYLLLLLENK